MHGTWFLAGYDLRLMLRQRETLLWTFVLPIVFFFFIGTIAGGGGVSGTPSPTTLLVENSSDGGFFAEQILRRVRENNFHVVDADTGATPEAYRFVLTVPPATTDSVLAGHPVRLRFQSRGNGLSLDYAGLRLRRAIYTALGDLLLADKEGPITEAALARATALPHALTLETRRAGRRHEIPSGFSQAVPGTMVMFTLLIMLTSGAVLLVLEREEGLLRRLASAPMGRSQVLAGKWGARLGLGIIQIGFAMLVGNLLFGVTWGPDLPMLLLVLLLYGGLCAALGLLLGNLARTRRQAVGIGVLTSNVLAALGGCWWPIEVTSPTMQKVALFLPTGWTMDALHKLVHFGAGPSSVLVHAAGLAAATVIVLWAGTRTFRYR